MIVDARMRHELGCAMVRSQPAIFACSALLLLSGCGSSASSTPTPESSSPSPVRAHFVLVSSDWLVTSSGTPAQSFPRAKNCALVPPGGRQECVPQAARLDPGTPASYAAHAVIRNDGDGPGSVPVMLGTRPSTCFATTPATPSGGVSEVTCRIGPVAQPGAPPQVVIENP